MANLFLHFALMVGLVRKFFFIAYSFTNGAKNMPQLNKAEISFDLIIYKNKAVF